MPKRIPGFLEENIPYSCRIGDHDFFNRYCGALTEQKMVHDIYVDHKRKRLYYDFNPDKQVLGFKMVAIHHTICTATSSSSSTIMMTIPLAVIAVLVADWDDFHDEQIKLNKRKFRCQSARIVGLISLDKRPIKEGVVAHSMYNPDIIYKEGEIVSSDDFDDNPDHECAPGIHYFTDFNSAFIFGIHC